MRQPNLPACTAQTPTIDDQPGFPNETLCSLLPGSKIHGHVDWMPATYHGRLAWIEVAADQDYNFAFFPDNSAGITKSSGKLPDGSAQYIELEFSSLETGGRFGTPSWQRFAEAASLQDSDAITKWLNVNIAEGPPQTVAIGLLNLDCEHDCHSELHPLYAMAIETNDSPADNTWTILARNWGNGGYCSGDNHELFLKGNELTVVLPNAGQQPPAVLWDKTEFAVPPGSGISFPRYGYMPGKGFVLSFKLPPPASRAMVELVLHLQWPSGTAVAPGLSPLAAKPTARRVEPPPAEGAEAYLERLFHSAGGDARKPPPEPARVAAVTSRDEPAPVPKSGKVPLFLPPASCTPGASGPCVPPAVKPATAETKRARDRAKFKQLCDLYKSKGMPLPADKIPNLARMCESPQLQ